MCTARKKGFGLIELLVIIAVVGVIAAAYYAYSTHSNTAKPPTPSPTTTTKASITPSVSPTNTNNIDGNHADNALDNYPTPTPLPSIDTTGWKKYSSTNMGVTFLYPDTFTVDEDKDDISISKDRYFISISASVDPERFDWCTRMPNKDHLVYIGNKLYLAKVCVFGEGMSNPETEEYWGSELETNLLIINDKLTIAIDRSISFHGKNGSEEVVEAPSDSDMSTGYKILSTMHFDDLGSVTNTPTGITQKEDHEFLQFKGEANYPEYGAGYYMFRISDYLHSHSDVVFVKKDKLPQNIQTQLKEGDYVLLSSNDVKGLGAAAGTSYAEFTGDIDLIIESSKELSKYTVDLDGLILSIFYPSTWQKVTGYEHRFGSNTGFVDYNLIASKDDIDTVANSEATHPMSPYGSKPKVSQVNTFISIDSSGLEARLIMPSNDQDPSWDNMASVLIKLPTSVSYNGHEYDYLLLYCDKTHIEALASFLRLED